MSIVYNHVYGNPENMDWNNAYEDIVANTFNQYNNYNILLKRVKPFNPNGRNESENEALAFDLRFRNFLNWAEIPYEEFDGSQENVEIIGEKIIQLMKG